jgi:hypothetical protein
LSLEPSVPPVTAVLDGAILLSGTQPVKRDWVPSRNRIGLQSYKERFSPFVDRFDTLPHAQETTRVRSSRASNASCRRDVGEITILPLQGTEPTSSGGSAWPLPHLGVGPPRPRASSCTRAPFETGGGGPRPARPGNATRRWSSEVTKLLHGPPGRFLGGVERHGIPLADACLRTETSDDYSAAPARGSSPLSEQF